jgi:CubicO group peptidase (beta-lactamase class C family)
LGVVAVALIAVSAGAEVGSTAKGAAQVSVDQSTLTEIEQYLEAQRSELGLPGMAAGLVEKSEVLLLRGFGDSIQADTPFLIASLSKSITALALMQLVEEGLVDLDAPVITYLPELAPGGDAISVRDLMHHRSGLTSYHGTEPLAGDLGSSLGTNVGRLGPLFEPAAPFEYSNANYDTMALIVERVSGVSFGEYMRRRVFDPLGMGRSTVDPEEAAELGLTPGHYHTMFLGYEEAPPPMPIGMPGSHTMFSTAEDLTHFLIAQLNGGSYQGTQVVSDESLRILREPRPYGPDTDLGYAGGWRVWPPNSAGFPEELAQFTTVTHDGGSMSYRGVMWMMPEADLGFVLLANANDWTDESLLPQVAANVQGLVVGLEPFEIVGLSDFLTRWSKHLLLLVILGQVALAFFAVRILRNMRRGHPPGTLGWIGLAAATLLDLIAAVLLIFVIPSSAETPLRVIASAPDYRLLIIAMMIGVALGIIRTGLVATWLIRWRSGRAAGPAWPDALA